MVPCLPIDKVIYKNTANPEIVDMWIRIVKKYLAIT